MKPARLPFQTCRRRYSAGSIGPLQACHEWSSRLSFGPFQSFATTTIYENRCVETRFAAFNSSASFAMPSSSCSRVMVPESRQLNRSKWLNNDLLSPIFHQGFDKQLLSMEPTHRLKLFLKKHFNTNSLKHLKNISIITLANHPCNLIHELRSGSDKLH